MKYSKTRADDVGLPDTEARTYTVIRTEARPDGRSMVHIQCPFCNYRVHAFKWSLAGTGKRCQNCGAMIGHLGTAYRVMGGEE